MLDLVQAASFLLVFFLAVSSHVYSFKLLWEDTGHKYNSKSAIIYKHMFAMDILIIFCFLPFKIIWLVGLQSNLVCRIIQFSGFMGFYGVMIFIIIMSLDRYFAIFKPFLHRTNKYHKMLVFSLSIGWLICLGTGLWHGVFIHRIGSATDNIEYDVCRMEASYYGPFQGNPIIGEININKDLIDQHYSTLSQ